MTACIYTQKGIETLDMHIDLYSFSLQRKCDNYQEKLRSNHKFIQYNDLAHKNLVISRKRSKPFKITLESQWGLHDVMQTWHPQFPQTRTASSGSPPIHDLLSSFGLHDSPYSFFLSFHEGSRVVTLFS